MTRRKQARTRPTALWLLEDHPLAAKYLLHVLHWQPVQRGLPARQIGTEPRRSPATELRSVRHFYLRPRVISLEEGLRHKPDGNESASVLVLDSGPMPGAILANLKFIRLAFPSSLVLILGKPVHEDDLLSLLFAGAKGYVSYGDVVKDLSRAIQHVSKGHVWVDRRVLDKLAQYGSAHTQHIPLGLPRFTPREEMVVDLLRRRLANKEIASILGIGERTVKYHLKSIYAKLSVHDRYTAADLVKATDLLKFEDINPRGEVT